jgi:hypothetical protein
MIWEAQVVGAVDLPLSLPQNGEVFERSAHIKITTLMTEPSHFFESQAQDT